jgi:hypothetical protein
MVSFQMLEAIEQRATSRGVEVDSRIERGRSYRHALARLLEKAPAGPVGAVKKRWR